MIEIDGSFGEGGGQILRTSLALSLITGKPFRLFNIRANRPKPGLAAQHLTCVQAAAEVGSATVSGAALRSRELTFEPGEVRHGEYHFPIGTAGSTSLVLHTIYLPLMWRTLGSSRIVLEGGTHVTTSPCYHFLEETWAGYLRLMGMRPTLEMQRPGFYPRGGGRVVVNLQSCESIRSLTLMDSLTPKHVHGMSAVAGLPDHIAQRQAQRATDELEARGIGADIDRVAWSGGPGSVIMLSVDDGPPRSLFVGLGSKGKPSEAVADEAVEQALAHIASGAPVDPHSADQILLPLAFAEGGSEYRTSEVTLHLTTNVDVIRLFLDREITVEGEPGSPGTVRVK